MRPNKMINFVLQAIGIFLIALLILVILVTISDKHTYSEPIESTRTVMLACTVKSNIDGVITLNDDCKITVIGEE